MRELSSTAKYTNKCIKEFLIPKLIAKGNITDAQMYQDMIDRDEGKERTIIKDTKEGDIYCNIKIDNKIKLNE